MSHRSWAQERIAAEQAEAQRQAAIKAEQERIPNQVLPGRQLTDSKEILTLMSKRRK